MRREPRSPSELVLGAEVTHVIVEVLSPIAREQEPVVVEEPQEGDAQTGRSLTGDPLIGEWSLEGAP